MRITQGRMIELAAAATAKSQSSAADAAAQVSSGLRVDRPSDDPTAWASAERAKVQRAVVAGSAAAIDASRGRLDETDAALATIGDVVSRVRELAVQGSSGSYNASDREQLAVEIRALMQSAVGAANARSADGEYLLAGSDSLAAPFDAAGAYTGDATARAVPTSATGITTATITGADLTAAGGVDVLPLLEQVAARLAANDPAGVSALLGDLESATKQVGLARSRTGSAMSVLDSTRNAHAILDENFAKEIARHVEVDTIDAASALAKASQALEVSRAVSAHVIAMVDPQP
jgi:flagellar hook-associated protein 3 FlgL